MNSDVALETKFRCFAGGVAARPGFDRSHLARTIGVRLQAAELARRALTSVGALGDADHRSMALADMGQIQVELVMAEALGDGDVARLRRIRQVLDAVTGSFNARDRAMWSVGHSMAMLALTDALQTYAS